MESGNKHPTITITAETTKSIYLFLDGKSIVIDKRLLSHEINILRPGTEIHKDRFRDLSINLSSLPPTLRGRVESKGRQYGDTNEKCWSEASSVSFDKNGRTCYKFTPWDVKSSFNEYCILMRLSHENIVAPINAILHNDSFVGFSMPTLRHFGETDKKCQANIRKLCSAVEYIHANNVFHCDIRDWNVMKSDDREPKLIDFGLALSQLDGVELMSNELREKVQNNHPSFATCSTLASNLKQLDVLMLILFFESKPHFDIVLNKHYSPYFHSILHDVHKENNIRL
ncbi:hypothetical protein GGI11_006945 [Coemansia sp. RSA 2049]